MRQSTNPALTQQTINRPTKQSNTFVCSAFVQIRLLRFDCSDLSAQICFAQTVISLITIKKKRLQHLKPQGHSAANCCWISGSTPAGRCELNVCMSMVAGIFVQIRFLRFMCAEAGREQSNAQTNKQAHLSTTCCKPYSHPFHQLRVSESSSSLCSYLL